MLAPVEPLAIDSQCNLYEVIQVCVSSTSFHSFDPETFISSSYYENWTCVRVCVPEAFVAGNRSLGLQDTYVIYGPVFRDPKFAHTSGHFMRFKVSHELNHT